MIKRLVEISRAPAHLAVRDGQLRVIPREDEAEERRIPCEDIGVLVVDEGGTTYSHQALAQLMDAGATVILCGRNHLPAGYLLPYPSHSELNIRIHQQLTAGKTLKKQLWQQLVSAKIRAQADNLTAGQPERLLLRNLAGKVRSGDPSNIEGQAAKAYWKSWLGPGTRFKRDPDGDGLNALLNYGYALIRAGLGRNLAGVGLLPMVGIHHCNRSNAFCLADDLLEPLRPLIDARVRGLHAEGVASITPAAKAALIGTLNATTTLEAEEMPLQIALKKLVDSLVQCYAGKRKALCIPSGLIPPE